MVLGTTSAFNRLPLEVLDLIVTFARLDFLSNPPEHLCLVSRAMCDVVQRHFFRHLHVQRLSPWRLKGLVNILKHNEGRLGKFVQHLYFKGGWDMWQQEYQQFPGKLMFQLLNLMPNVQTVEIHLDVDDWSFSNRRMGKLNALPLVRELELRLSECNNCATNPLNLISQILKATPNVQALTLGTDSDVRLPSFSLPGVAIHRHPAVTLPLASLSLSGNEMGQYFLQNNLLSINSLVKVTQLTIDATSSPAAHSAPLLQPSSSPNDLLTIVGPNITQLDLSGGLGGLGDVSLEVALKFCPNIATLAVSTAYRGFFDHIHTSLPQIPSLLHLVMIRTKKLDDTGEDILQVDNVDNLITHFTHDPNAGLFRSSAIKEIQTDADNLSEGLMRGLEKNGVKLDFRRVF